MFQGVCVCVYCAYVCLCMSPYALWMQVCVCKCRRSLPLLPPFHSDNICHQLQHAPSLPRLPHSPNFPPSLPPSSDKGSSVTHHLKGRLRLGKRSSYRLKFNNTDKCPCQDTTWLSLVALYLLPRLQPYVRAYAHIETHRRSDTYLFQHRCFQ